MKRILVLAAILIPFLALSGSADCGKNSDACSAGTKKISPFLSAVAAAEKKDPPAASAGKKAPVPSPAAAAAAPASPAAQELPVREFSSPAWLVFVAALVAGLYFYLGGGQKKRKKK